jgi:hypothetical protein
MRYQIGDFGFNLQQRYIAGTTVNNEWLEGIDVDDNTIESQTMTGLTLFYQGETATGWPSHVVLATTNVAAAAPTISCPTANPASPPTAQTTDATAVAPSAISSQRRVSPRSMRRPTNGAASPVRSRALRTSPNVATEVPSPRARTGRNEYTKRIATFTIRRPNVWAAIGAVSSAGHAGAAREDEA